MLNISISVKLLDKYEFYSAICKNYPLYNMSYQTKDNTGNNLYNFYVDFINAYKMNKNTQ